eukprot:Clim_evm61s203 gene=Clim_evmTU61s203
MGNEITKFDYTRVPGAPMVFEKYEFQSYDKDEEGNDVLSGDRITADFEDMSLKEGEQHAKLSGGIKKGFGPGEKAMSKTTFKVTETVYNVKVFSSQDQELLEKAVEEDWDVGIESARKHVSVAFMGTFEPEMAKKGDNSFEITLNYRLPGYLDSVNFIMFSNNSPGKGALPTHYVPRVYTTSVEGEDPSFDFTMYFQIWEMRPGNKRLLGKIDVGGMVRIAYNINTGQKDIDKMAHRFTTLQERDIEETTARKDKVDDAESAEQLDAYLYQQTVLDIKAFMQAFSKYNPIGDSFFVAGRDDTMLHIAEFPPSGRCAAGEGDTSDTQMAVLFLNAVGKASRYTSLVCDKLAKEKSIRCYIMDVRGHGKSGGKRGDSPDRETVWSDIRSVVRHLRWHAPHMTLAMGGLFANCGVALNYCSWKGREPVDGLIFVAPSFGPNSTKLYRLDNFDKYLTEMGLKLNLNAIRMNKALGGLVNRHAPVITLKREQEEFSMTYAQLSAVMPENVKKQMQLIDVPFTLIIGEKDELVKPPKIAEYIQRAQFYKINAKKNTGISPRILQGVCHLEILLYAHEHVAEQLTRMRELKQGSRHSSTSSTGKVRLRRSSGDFSSDASGRLTPPLDIKPARSPKLLGSQSQADSGSLSLSRQASGSSASLGAMFGDALKSPPGDDETALSHRNSAASASSAEMRLDDRYVMDFTTFLAKVADISTPPEGFFLEAIDGSRLVYGRFLAAQPDLVDTVFIAFSGIKWWSVVADQLATEVNVTSYALDIRGRGMSDDVDKSGGTRDLLWLDIRKFVRTIKYNHPGCRLVLAASSFMAGVLINYALWDQREKVDGLVMLSPFFLPFNGNDNIVTQLAKDILTHKIPENFNLSQTVTNGHGRNLQAQKHVLHHLKESKSVPPILGAKDVPVSVESIKTVDPTVLRQYSPSMIMSMTLSGPLEDAVRQIDIPIAAVHGSDAKVINLDELRKAFHSRDGVIMIDDCTFEEGFWKASPYIAKWLTNLIYRMTPPEPLARLDNPKLEDLEKIELIGTGAFSRVWLVKHKETGAAYTMKIMSKRTLIDMEQSQGTVYERQILEQCRSHFIVNYIGRIQDAKMVYLLMEYVIGGELFTQIRLQNRFDEKVARFFLVEITCALEYLHSRNIIYRDLKTTNILITSKGHAKLADFGFAKKLSGSGKTTTFCGTPEYLAPEIIQDVPYGYAVDWYAMGILAYEMVVGHLPFRAHSPSELARKILEDQLVVPSTVTPDVKSLILELTNKSSRRRLGGGKQGWEEVKAHKLFAPVDWRRAQNCQIVPPIVVQTRSALDTSNFIDYGELPDQEMQSISAEEQHLFADF